MTLVKGTLIPIGGNEDKGIESNEMYTLEFIGEGILAHVLKEAGGVDAKIVIITTASSIPIEIGKNYLTAFQKLGCRNIHVLDIRSKRDAEQPTHIALVKQANCVMFSGGDQSKITNKIGGTAIHNIIAERYRDEEYFVVAGTSAGAMAMGQEMIASGSSKEALVKGAVKMYQGIGLIPELIIDTHFIQRGRFGRQAEAVAKFPRLLGVGLSEDTGLIIKNGKNARVIGSGMVIVFDGSNLVHNNETVLYEGTPMTLTNLVVHVLSNGDQIDIESKEITVLPVHASFI